MCAVNPVALEKQITIRCKGFSTFASIPPSRHSMRPAHVSFPIDCNLTDTRGNECPHTAAFPAESTGSLYFGFPAMNVFSAAVEEMGNVWLPKCLKTTANRALTEKVKQLNNVLQ